jgi:acylphosphatase
VFEGEPGLVAALVEWCRHGPGSARVTNVHVTDEPPHGERDFRIV